jgi:hypothetical protein
VLDTEKLLSEISPLAIDIAAVVVAIFIYLFILLITMRRQPLIMFRQSEIKHTQ